jgi:acyl-CoA thioesterase FadM
MDYLIRDSETGRIFGEGKTVQVAYDYQTKKTIPLNDTWRQAIQAFEDLKVE